MWDFPWTFFKGGENGKDPGQINVVPNVGRLQTSMTECSCSRKILLCCSRPFFGLIGAFFNSGPSLRALSLSEPILPPLLLTNVNESYKKKY